MMTLKEGMKIRFSPLSPDHLESYYTLDGVKIGDKGVISRIDDDGDVVVNFTRSDGTLSEGFYVFYEDIEVISD